MLKRAAVGVLFVTVLVIVTPRRARSEEYVASKVLYYFEDKNRIKVVAPTVAFQKETLDGWTIKVDGIYNSISGATPTGAPPPVRIVTPTVIRTTTSTSSGGSTGGSGGGSSGGDDDGGGDDKRASAPASPTLGKKTVAASKFSAVSAASGGGTTGGGSTAGGTSSSSGSSTGTVPSSGSSVSAQTSDIPTADFSDERVGFNIGLSKRVGRHTPGGQLSFSSESDYTSLGLSLQDAVDFNKKNTTFLFGGAYTHDIIAPANGTPDDIKRSADAMLGLTQVLSPSTLLTLNFTLGQVSGFISDPYKVVELNGRIVNERRPESKDKQIAFFALDQFIAPLNGTAELSFRHYSDSFGINAETLTLEWFQKLGDHFVLAPMIRYYDQTAADFYAVRFTGNPEYYSSDYRVSAFTAMGYGLRLIWSPSSTLSLDLGVEAYGQKGKDGVTPKDVYPNATAVTAGFRLTL